MSILQEIIQDILFTDNKYSCNFSPSKRNIDAVNGLPTAPDKSQAASLTIRLVCREVYTKVQLALGLDECAAWCAVGRD